MNRPKNSLFFITHTKNHLHDQCKGKCRFSTYRYCCQHLVKISDIHFKGLEISGFVGVCAYMFSSSHAPGCFLRFRFLIPLLSRTIAAYPILLHPLSVAPVLLSKLFLHFLLHPPTPPRLTSALSYEFMAERCIRH